MTSYRFTYSVYERPFRQPLHTSHGIWAIREGIIVQLTDELGRSHAGEIAPIPWFGSESLPQAIEYCDRIGDKIDRRQIESIPDTLPACQFGFGSAFTYSLPQCKEVSFNRGKGKGERGKGSEICENEDLAIDPSPHELCALLPTGAAAIAAWQALFSKGYRTFKWKIGVAPIAEELAIWQDLITALPPDAKLRLDANGGLTAGAAVEWLERCSRESQIEFIEQPLAPDAIEATIELSQTYPTPIALDESVATFDRLEAIYNRGWRGIYVIKPGIAGFPWRLAEFITEHQLDVVFSSVLETSVGRTAALQLAAKLQLTRALGFGVDAWFEDGNC
jgi:o-succinylbenzoate synthase